MFNDLKSLVIKSQVLYKDAFIKDILNICSPRLFILTGSFVNRPDVGVDVFIVGRVAREKLKVAIRNLEKAIDREVNFTLMEPAEFKYRREIADMFLYSILDGEKIMVVDEIGLS